MKGMSTASSGKREASLIASWRRLSMRSRTKSWNDSVLIDRRFTSSSTGEAALGSMRSARPLPLRTAVCAGWAGAGRAAGADTLGAVFESFSMWAMLSGGMASTSTPSGQGLVDSTTASSPKAWRTRVSASRELRAVKRLQFMPVLLSPSRYGSNAFQGFRCARARASAARRA